MKKYFVKILVLTFVLGLLSSEVVAQKKKAKTTKQKRDANIPSGVDGFSQQELLNLIMKAELSGDASGLDPSSQFYSKPSNSNSRNSSSSSSSNTSNSNSGKKSHEFNVIVQWQKTCGNCSFPSPSTQNGIVDLFHERSGSYRVIPVCPICGKKQYKTVNGFTINMIGGNKTFRVVCMGKLN